MTAARALRRLREFASPERARVSMSFFKTGPGEYGEGDRFLGLTVPDLRKVAREFRELPLAEVSKLLASPWHEARLLAVLVLVEQYRRGDEAAREEVYRLYLASTSRINNWDLVDASAPHIVGAHADRRTLVRLARSESLWERRIAMIATQSRIRCGEFEDALRIATILVNDPHDLLHKAVGWMLREIGDRDRAVEEGFLREHAARMPRTMLRYAIEKFPEGVRRGYLSSRA